MPGHRAIVAIVCSVLLFGLCATTATADPLTFRPSGELVFNLSFHTQGIFSCSTATPFCAGSGTNSVVIGSGNGPTSPITFRGVTINNLQVHPDGTPNVVLGEFHTFSPAGFSPFSPSLIPTHGTILRLDFSIIETDPVPSVRTATWDFGPLGDLRALGRSFFPTMGTWC